MNLAPEALSTTDKPVLISFSICPFVQRSAIVLNEKKQPFERINIDLKNKPQWFMDLSPTGKVPVLVVNNDKHAVSNRSTVFESAIINEYLDEQFGESLMPTDILRKAQHRSWISFSESLIFLQFRTLSAKTESEAHNTIDELFIELKKLHPGDEGYFDGDRLSLIDAAFAPIFTRIKWLPALREKLEFYAQDNSNGGNLLRWIDNIVQLDAVKNSVGGDFDQQFEAYFINTDSALLKQHKKQQRNAA